MSLFKKTTPLILLASYAVSSAGVQAGVCVLDFAQVPANYQNIPGYFNLDGLFIHSIDEPWEPATVTRFLSCYEQRTEAECEGAIGKEMHIWFPPPDGQDAIVTSAHWFTDANSCKQLEDLGILPKEPPKVALYATDVELTAIRDGDQVNLELTATGDRETAIFQILQGENLRNGGTKVTPLRQCRWPAAPAGVPHTYECTDERVGNYYRVLEIEHDGELIVYDEVIPVAD